ncbi:MAG: hypothetical protein LCH73_05345 [Proteobacteria bacterium]|nr:hypothetical protein [Pseudomonadota bacterium]
MACRTAWALAESAPPTNPPPPPDPPAVEWRLSGFATLGLQHVDSNAGLRFARQANAPRASGATDLGADSRLGLQLEANLPHNLEAVGQVVAKRLDRDDPRLGNRLELGYLAWHPDDHWRLRVGRYAPDLFLLAEYRNVGFAYPWVRPNTEVYAWLPISSLDGADVRYQWMSDDDALWRLRGSVGEWRGTLPVIEANPHLHHRQRTVSLTREAGPLTLRASYTHSTNIVTVAPALDPAQLMAPLAQVASLPLSPQVQQEALTLRNALPLDRPHLHYAGLGLLYEGGPWLVHAELTRTKGGQAGVATGRGYASLGWRTGAFTWFGTVSRSHALSAPARLDAARWQADLTPLVGPQAAAALTGAGVLATRVVNIRRSEQRVYGLGLRWDVGNQAAIKLQVDRYHLGAQATSGWNLQVMDGTPRATQLSLAWDQVF